MPTRREVIARISEVEPHGSALEYALAVPQPLYGDLTASTPDELLMRLTQRSWASCAPTAGAYFSDGMQNAGFVQLQILNSTPEAFYAVTGTGQRQRMETAGLAFICLPAG